MPLKSFLNVVTRPRVKFSGRFTEQNIGIRFHLTHSLSIVLVGTSTLRAYRPLDPSRESRDSTELSHVPNFYQTRELEVYQLKYNEKLRLFGLNVKKYFAHRFLFFI